MRRKLSEMEPFERVESRMKDLSNDEAEEVAVTILAQVIAKHIYVFRDEEAYFDLLMRKLADATNKFAIENALPLAMSGAVYQKKC